MKKLYRSTNTKIISGVCGGLAEYFDLDPTLIRIIWAFSSIVSIAIGVIVYIICAIIIPCNPNSSSKPKISLEKRRIKRRQTFKTSFSNSRFAFFLIILGGILLLDNYIDFNLLDFDYLFPLGLIALGLNLLLKDRDSNES